MPVPASPGTHPYAPRGTIACAPAQARQAPGRPPSALEATLGELTRQLAAAAGELEALGRERDVAALDRDTFQQQVTALRADKVRRRNKLRLLRCCGDERQPSIVKQRTPSSAKW
jgi:hypothetical protein